MGDLPSDVLFAGFAAAAAATSGVATAVLVLVGLIETWTPPTYAALVTLCCGAWIATRGALAGYRHGARSLGPAQTRRQILGLLTVAIGCTVGAGVLIVHVLA